MENRHFDTGIVEPAITVDAASIPSGVNRSREDEASGGLNQYEFLQCFDTVNLMIRKAANYPQILFF